ncbi:MAG: glycosyltransferase family 39 protein [Anaerolineales bacterium]
MSTNSKRLIGALVFFIWMTLLVAAFYVVQKPSFMAGMRGIADTLWLLMVWGLLVVNGMGLGHFLLQSLPVLPIQPVERLLIGAGVGLGLLGLIGFLIGLLGWVHPVLLIGSQAGLLLILWWRKILHAVGQDLRVFALDWHECMAAAPSWIKITLGLTLLLAFLLALAPPAEGFDALFYHLPGPERVLSGIGLQPSSVPHFWFPALPEDVFLWAQGMGSVRATQLLHLTWAVLSALLLWYWAVRIWDSKTAQASLIILISMPSLYLLASWAYTDFALTFYGLVTIYGVFKTHENNADDPLAGWVIVAGIAAGMAMGVKYTSFLVPMTAGLLLFWWQRKNLAAAVRTVLIFSIVALAVASPWYLRNWAVMGNPFYPFAFGGNYWDDFRATGYSDTGTGIGWNLKELLLLPLNATLGHRDANYYDGRIGPLYLILAPLAVYVLFASKRYTRQQHRAIFSIGLYTLLSLAAWTLGVFNSSALWQTRLLFPALIPFAIPTALGWLALQKLDTSQLRISFIFKFVVIAILTINLVNASLSVIERNPLAYTTGLETLERYLEKVQPSYTQAAQLVGKSPEDSKVYFLFEPRSYYMPRTVQPDATLDNLSHGIYLYGDSDGVLASWQAEGFTHVLIYRRGADFIKGNAHKFSSEHQVALEFIIQNHLDWVGSTSDGAYEFYSIHPEK